MLETDGHTIGQVFAAAVRDYPDHPLLMVPRDSQRAYAPNGCTITFAQAGQFVDATVATLMASGYGHGHRIAVMLNNRPQALLLKLAFSALGISWVPINPDYRAGEIAYLLQDSGAHLVVSLAEHSTTIEAAKDSSASNAPVAVYADDGRPPASLPRALTPALLDGPVHVQTEASLLYTSGTTGRPKGCIMGHEYELMMGAWYATRGGALTFKPGAERIYNPLPLFHVNAGIMTLMMALVSGNCHIVPERFSARRWWPEICQTRATGIHYLGVVIAVLMIQPVAAVDARHCVRWGMGAGVEPTLHRAFEARFGFALVEVWGMTEMCRVLADCHEPRAIDTRAVGRPITELEVRVVDDQDNDVICGQSGELLIRHSAQHPRRGAFSGYLNHPQVTEEAWRGGWFHTGDTVTQDASGMVFFIDRKKNIIRRAGENIAAAEVEAVLQSHEAVVQVAVMPIEDEVREEEVMACIVTACPPANAALAQRLFQHCFEQLAYFKAPGWIVFVPSLPVTGTQKILKHKIFPPALDPRQAREAHDMRALKKRA